MSNKVVKSLSIAVGAALLGTVAVANAGDLFRVNDLGFGYQVTGEDHAEGKCGEGKCGDDKKAEGSCGADKKEHAEGKCGEGKCGEGKCGEGKCGDEKKEDAAAAKSEDAPK